MARPLLTCVLLIIACHGSIDFWEFGAIGCLLLGQTIIRIAQTRPDGSRQKRNSVVRDENQPEQVTTFFLANNVAILVKSPGDLFRKGVSSIFCKKLEKPVCGNVDDFINHGGCAYGRVFADKFQSYVPAWTCSASLQMIRN